ncbi:thiamine phosphate synthase [Sphingobacterium suaedae]|uniref:Thiamine-phosphate synthase n=1 Tax=Sphingobacterium suaedae TaxID=1686402 RepID=A0ABW5KG59_9SPHI
MPFNPAFPYPLYLVISEKDCAPRPWLWVAEQAIRGGVDIIQLREKDASTPTLLEKARRLKLLTDRYTIPLLINDRADIATQVSAWGVHVGQQDMQPLDIQRQYADQLHIGWSLENLRQLDSPQMQAVHHLGVSPIFATATKTNTITEWGYAGLSSIYHATDKPLIGIGNMNKKTAQAAYQAGACSVAVVSAICSAKDPQRTARFLKQQLT